MGDFCKVLIVDDEILVRQGIKHYLNWEREGFQIVGEASNGQEALTLIERLSPHIVLTDIVMPVMDGDEFSRILKSAYPEIEVIVLSSFGEFDYVRSTFQSGVADYILKPKLEGEDLLKILKQTAKKIPFLNLHTQAEGEGLSMDYILDKLINGYEVDHDENKMSAAFPYPSFYLFGADLRRSICKGKVELDRMREYVNLALAEDIQNMVSHPLPLDGNLLVFLLNAETSEKDAVVRTAEKIAGTYAHDDPHLCWLLSREFDRLGRLGEVYRTDFLKLFDYRFYFPGRHLLVHSELPEPPLPGEPFNLNQFTEELKRRQFDAAFRHLLEHAAGMAKNYTVDIFEFKTFLGHVIFNIIILLGNLDFDIRDLEEFKYSCFKAIDDAEHAGEVMRLLEDFIAKAKTCICDGSTTAGNPNMKRLLAYIDEHFAEPLTLTELAKHFHFNPSYLSSAFSAYNKLGFSEYLNTVRVKKASSLLRAGEDSISEICGKVGYSDQSYFCKVFKKFTGFSPSQFRRKYAK